MTLDPGRFPAALLAAIGFEQVLASSPDGSADVAYLADAAFTHSQGRVVQGGFVTAWLDNAMAFAVHARDAGAGVATLEIKVSFIRVAGPGRHVARARIVHWGRSVAFLEAEIEGDDGVVARASSTVKLRRPGTA